MASKYFSMIQRQMALVSYGSKFLQKELALDDCYSHEIFAGALFQFRGKDKLLLADECTLWLGTLAQDGATRLSLHMASELGVAAPPGLDRNIHVVVAQYPDRHQLWAAGREHATWREHRPALSNVAADAGDVDCFCCIEERPGTLEVPSTDWKALANAIAADLEIAVPSSAVPVAPTTMPLFVATGTASLAHRVLATLYAEQAKFENDTHMKNDNSFYQHLDAAGAAAVDHWSQRLNSWIGEVHLRCANEGGSRAACGDEPQFSRLQAPLQPATADDTGALASKAPAPAKEPWTGRIALAVAIAALSLLVLACANLIALHPWLAVLIGLPWVLYTRREK